MTEIYPYPKDAHEHPYAFVFYHAAGLGLNFDASNDLAKHVFDYLRCGPPGTVGEPTIKYDALGTDGGPWKAGTWIGRDESRREVVVTVPAKSVKDMTPEERAELRQALEMAEVAEQAGTLSHSDETGVE